MSTRDKIFRLLFQRITPRLVFPLLMVSVLAIALMAYFVTTIIIEKWIDRIRSDEIRFNKITANIISEQQSDLIGEVRTLAGDERLKAAILKRDRDSIANQLSARQRGARIDVIEVINSNGEVLFRSNDPLRFGDKLPESHPAVSGFKSALADGFFEREEDKGILKHFVYVFEEPGKPIGAIIGGLFLDQNWALFTSNIVTVDITLYDAIGTITSSFSDKKAIPPASPEAIQELLYGQAAHITLVPSPTGYRWEVIERFRREVYYNGTPYEVGYFPLQLLYFAGGLPAYFSLALPVTDIYVVKNQILRTAVLISIGAIALIISAGYITIAFRIIRPIKGLVWSFGQVSAGKLDTKIEKISGDEIGDLAFDFNKMVESLRVSKERDEMVSRLKSEFLTIAAHQLRTPLSAVKWALRIVLDEELGDISQEQKNLLVKTYRSNERMISLINSLLNATRIEEGRYLYKSSFGRFEDVVKPVIDSYKEEIKRRKIIFELKTPKDPLPKTMLDTEKMKLAVQNLLDNAIRYTKPEGKVTVELGYDKGKIKFSIKDTGVGIPKEQQNRIFTKFFRGANIMRMETEGSGLGLFIVKNIIEAHGGRIWFESEENKGTVFYFTLPVLEKG